MPDSDYQYRVAWKRREGGLRFAHAMDMEDAEGHIKLAQSSKRVVAARIERRPIGGWETVPGTEWSRDE